MVLVLLAVVVMFLLHNSFWFWPLDLYIKVIPNRMDQAHVLKNFEPVKEIVYDPLLSPGLFGQAFYRYGN